MRNPYATRPWQHVLDPLNGYLILAKKTFENTKIYSDAFNFGPEKKEKMSVIKVCKKFLKYAKSDIKILIKKNKNNIVLTFKSKSFLQQQVRSMVGSLKYLGEGKWDLKDFKKAFLSKKRSMCAPPAPACGLYLAKVKY